MQNQVVVQQELPSSLVGKCLVAEVGTLIKFTPPSRTNLDEIRKNEIYKVVESYVQGFKTVSQISRKVREHYRNMMAMVYIIGDLEILSSSKEEFGKVIEQLRTIVLSSDEEIADGITLAKDELERLVRGYESGCFKK